MRDDNRADKPTRESTLKRRHSLMGKALSLFILIVAIPAIVGGLIAMNLFLNILVDKATTSYEHSINSLHGQLSSELFETKMSAYYMYLDLDIKQALHSFNSDPVTSYRARQYLADKFSKYQISPNFRNVNAMKVYGFNGLTISLGDSQFSEAINDDWVINNPLYQQALAHPERFIWSGIHPEGTGPGISGSISMFRVIMDRSYSDGVAMLYVNLDSKLFATLVNSRNQEEDSHIYVLDSSNTSVGGELVPDFVVGAVQEHIDQQRSDHAQTLDLGDDKRLLLHYLADYNWKVVGVMELDKLAQSSRDLIGIFVLGFVLFLVLSSLIWLALVSYLLAPIKALQAATQRVHQGDFSVQVQAHGRDEIGELTQDFNYMVSKIDNLMAQQLAQTKREKDAEYRALQAQINPHFLYNTLNSIRWMAILQKADNIKRVVEVLGRLLRNSTRKMDQFVAIDDEIANLKDYVFIELTAYSNSFQVEYDYDNRLGHYRCFKFLLQPLVENAIFHGVLPKEGMGVIRVKVAHVEDPTIGPYIEFEVFDDGIGMPESAASEPIAKAHKMNSIGLSSVQDRLKMCYGDQHFFSIESTPGRFTRITLRIPAQEHIDA